MKNEFKVIISEEAGQGMVEYSLIIVMVALVVIGGLYALQGGVINLYNKIYTEVNKE